jgi:hypothetical protein
VVAGRAPASDYGRLEWEMTGRCETSPESPEPGGYGPADPADDLDYDADYEAWLGSRAHDCPREAFLDDPITVAYGVGSEMLHLIPCAVCDAEEEA